MQINEISMALWIIFFVFSGIFGILLTRKAFKPEFERPQREYYLGIAIFIFIHIVARISYYYYDFIDAQELYWELGALIGIGSVIFLIYAIERHIYTRSKFIITIIATINLTVLLIITIVNFMNPGFISPDIKLIIQIINTAVIGLFIPLIYLYVAIKSSSTYRRNSLLIAIGIIIFLGGRTAHNRGFFIPDNILYFILSPTLMLIGGVIFLYGLLKPA